MREYKFRGYAVEEMIGSQWLYGYGVTKINYTDGTSSVYLLTPYGDYRVEEDSVGQYIGLRNKNGTEIYEGDIIRTNDFYECGELIFKGKITEVKSLDYYINGCTFIDTSGEIIGNTYENSNLLENK